MTVNQLFDWTGGTLATSGTTLALGGISIDASSSADGEVQLSGGTLVNAAGQTAIFTGTGNFDIGNGGTLVNSGTFEAENSQGINDNFPGSSWRGDKELKSFCIFQPQQAGILSEYAA